MIRLIASDLDGTLLPYGEASVSTEAKRLISEILSNNIHFAVASGRAYSELIHFLPEFEKDIYYICCDGACCIKDGKVIYSRHISRENLEFIAKSSKNIPCIYHAAHKSYFTGEINSEHRQLFLPEKISRLNDIPQSERIYKVTLLSSPLRLPAHIGLRMHWMGGEADSTTQYVNRFCHKGAALSDLEARLFLTGLDTAVIGDADNDIPMMRGAKYSFAVGNRSKALSCEADYTVPTVETALYRILSLAKKI